MTDKTKALTNSEAGTAPNYLELFYKNHNSDKGDIYNCYYDGSDWKNDNPIVVGQKVPATSKVPNAILYNSNIYLFYVGKNSGDIFSSSFDGSAWSGDTSIKSQPGSVSASSNQGPSAVVYKDYIAMFHKGESGNNKLYALYYDGKKWLGGKAISDLLTGNPDPQSDVAPSAVVYKDLIYIFYKQKSKDKNSSDDLYYVTTNGKTWSQCQPVQIDGTNAKSSDTPHAAVFNDAIWLVYKSDSSTSILTSTFTINNSGSGTWAGNTEIDNKTGKDEIKPLTDCAPNAVVYDNKLYIFYKNHGSSELYTAWYDNVQWCGAESIKAMDSTNSSNDPIDPKSDRTPGCVVY